MKGLIIKDFISTKSYLKTLLLMIIAIFGMGAFTDQIEFFLPLLIVLMSMLTFVTFSYDQACHWDVYGRTLPISMKQVVLSKYLVGLISIVAGVVIVTLLMFGFSLFPMVSFNQESLMMIGIYTEVALIFLAFISPVIYRFGVEKSRLIMLLACFTPVFVLNLVKSLGIGLPMVSEGTIQIFLMCSPIFSLILYAISFVLSVKIFCKQEL